MQRFSTNLIELMAAIGIVSILTLQFIACCVIAKAHCAQFGENGPQTLSNNADTCLHERLSEDDEGTCCANNFGQVTHAYFVPLNQALSSSDDDGAIGSTTLTPTIYRTGVSDSLLNRSLTMPLQRPTYLTTQRFRN